MRQFSCLVMKSEQLNFHLLLIIIFNDLITGFSNYLRSLHSHQAKAVSTLVHEHVLISVNETQKWKNMLKVPNIITGK